MKRQDKINRGSEVNQLMSMEGFHWIKKDMENEIELLTNHLINGDFSTLLEVKEAQMKIRIYTDLLNRWHKWTEESVKLLTG